MVSIRYRIQPKHPGAHLFEVNCVIATPHPDGQVVTLPAWIPGSYMIRDFAKNVVRIEAEAGGTTVALEKLDKQTWRCAPCTGPLTLRYEVYAWDLSVRAAHLDTTHGYFNGPSVFLRVAGQDDAPCTVDIVAPEGGGYAAWRVATAMPADGAPAYGFGRYRAANYDELLDHPVEMGEFSLVHFEACGVPHDIAITGRHRADMERLRRDLKTVCEHHIRFFGEPAPMQRYVFLVMAVGEGHGGLEHRASTSLLCSRDDLPLPGETKVSEGYREFLELCSHEYFHTWQVKRIKPAAFVPYDLRQENYTRLLWAFEGITSYYDDLALVRSGLISPDAYIESLGQMATRVWRSGGRLKQSVADSSLDAWTKFYKQDENAPNAIISYYTKGALIALALDLTLRRGSDGRCSLDEVMGALWRRYGQTGVGVPEDGVERLAAEISGMDLGAFFDQAVRGTTDLPLADLLADVGIDVCLRPAESQNDKGGKLSQKSDKDIAIQGVLGVKTSVAGNNEVRIAHVFDGGPAQAAGLSAQDVIVAIDGLRVSPGGFDKRVASYRPGATVHIHAFRRDELMEFQVTLQAPPADTVVLSLRKDADAATLARRQAWLSGRA